MLDERNGFYITKDGYIDLTPLETKCLSYFIERKNQKTPVQLLANYLYNTTNTAKAILMVHRLNKKLAGYIKIHNHRPLGYQIQYIGD